MRTKEHYLRAILIIGSAVGLLALYQWLDAVAWSNFILHTADVPLYQTKVLGLSPSTSFLDLGYIYDITPLRVSSIFLSPFDLADYLVLATAVAAVRINANRRDVLNYLALGTAVAAIFFTRSRSDGLAAIVILVLIVLPSSRSQQEGRARLLAVMLLGAVLIVPALGGTRFDGAQGGTVTATGHDTELVTGFRVLVDFFGVGLGDNPATATRFTAATAGAANPNFVTDNLVFQVGDELGFQALLPWLLMMGFILWECKRRGGKDPFAAALGFALLGIVIAGLYHQVFLTFPVPWSLWAGLGLACSARTPSSYDEDALATNLAAPVAGVP